MQTDTGEARRALERLLIRIERNPGEPETFTGLVHVFRFCDYFRSRSRRWMPLPGPQSEIKPEVLVYLARHYSYIGSADAAIKALKRAAQSGFVCAPETLRSDVWLSAARAPCGLWICGVRGRESGRPGKCDTATVERFAR